MKIFRALALAFSVALAPLAGAFAEAPVVGPSTYSYNANGQYNVWACTGGQSTFQLNVPSGLTGTFTVTVGQGSATATQNPPWAFAPGSAAFANTITNNGSLTVELGSNQYVKVATTAYSSGSTTVSGVCSSSVSVLPPGALTTSANSWSGLQTFNGGVAANSFAPIAFPTPNSSSTIVAFGDSLTYGAYGPTSCVTAQNQPTGVAGSAATGKCWLDVIAHDYNVSAAYDLGVGGSPLTQVGPAGNGAGILRYNASYTCPAQSASPTSGLDNNCKGSAVLPALDSLVNANSFLVIGYFGHNDNYFTWGNSDYSTYLSNLQTIIADAEAHGQDPHKIIFLGSMRGSNGSNINQYQFADLITSKANAYEASVLGARYVDLTTPLATKIVANNGSSLFYDSIHPNDATNCSGASCLGGSAVIASTIESSTDLPAAFYAAALGIAGEMSINSTAPIFDAQGNLTVPFNSSLQAGSYFFGQNGQGYYVTAGVPSYMLKTDTANTIIQTLTGGGATYFQSNVGGNEAHITTGGSMYLDGGGEYHTGSSYYGATGAVINGPLNISPASTQYIQFGGNDVIGWDTSNTIFKAATSGGAVYMKKSDGTNVAHFDSAGLTIDTGTLITTATDIQFGGGVVFQYGAGGPSGSCTNGSLYVRSDVSASANNTTYDCRGGAWQALSGG